MLHRGERFLAGLAISLLIGMGQPVSAGGGSEVLTPIADHHLHIQSELVTAMIQRNARDNPDAFGHLNPGILEDRSMTHILATLDNANISCGVLLSEGYMFSSIFSDMDPEEAARKTRAENQYNYSAARGSDGRLVTFVGINPFSDYATRELEYWSNKWPVVGVKVQLGNSGYDPESVKQRATLASLLSLAHKNDMAVVLHLRSKEEYTSENVTTFVDEILPEIQDTPIQIAHGGGHGKLDQPTVDALRLFADAVNREAPGTQNLVVDLSLVVVDDQTDPALAADFVNHMRSMGLDRFVIGSDWPSLYEPVDHNELLVRQLPLSSSEWSTVFDNRAPYLTSDCNLPENENADMESQF